jgi:hypothetical protein
MKDTCQKIKKLNPIIDAKIEGCQTGDVQNLLKLIFDDPEQMKVTCFEEVIRYTEYCRRLALQNNERRKGNEPARSNNVKKNGSNDFDVSQPFHRSLVYLQLIGPGLSVAKKRRLAEQAKEALMSPKWG